MFFRNNKMCDNYRSEVTIEWTESVYPQSVHVTRNVFSLHISQRITTLHTNKTPWPSSVCY